MLRATAFLLLFHLLYSMHYGQIKSIGLPFINNYSKTTYKAGSQTWDMVQDNNGIMYFANNDGILEFDGVDWKVYPTKNLSVVRSVAIGADQIIYAGAYNEIGYLKKNPNGALVYQSLINKIPVQYRNFDEIWKIFQTPFGLVFQSFNYIFIYQNGEFTVIKPFSRFGFSFLINGTYYVIDKEKGIVFFNRGNLTPIANQPEVFYDDEIRFILPLNNSLLIGVLNHGLYILQNDSIKPWNTPVNKYIKQNHIFSAVQLTSGHYVFGTIRDGFFVTDKNGIVLQHINRDKGLQNNTILSLFADKSGNIWSGLDNGISYTEISSPATILNHCFGIETGYVSLIHNNILYLGTNQGLFAKSISQLPNNPEGDDNFTLIDGTQGQVWTLFPHGNYILCGHNNGTFMINGFTAVKISTIRGVWKFLQRNYSTDELIAGTYTGLISFKKLPTGEWGFSHIIKGFNESCKDFIEDSDGNLLVSHGYKGIYRIKFNEKADSVTDVTLFDHSHGLPAQLPYELHKLFGVPFISTNQGFYQYDKNSGKFNPSEKFNHFFNENRSVLKIFTDSSSNIWYAGNRKMGVYRMLEDGNYREVYTPFNKFSYNLVPAFEHIFPYNEHNVFIGVQDGFIHYDPTIIKKYTEQYPVFIREVRFLKKYNDSIISFTGNYSQDKSGKHKIEIKYNANSLAFRYASPFFEDPDKTEYRCRLKGYTEEWGPWETRTMREYTNLHEGTYTFEVQSRNIYQTQSNTDSFTFTVLPPFHRSTFAYTLYLIVLVSIIFLNIVYFRRRMARTRLRDKQIHERKMKEQEHQFREESLIAEKEIEHLKNEKLQSEMKHKNRELANSTMHIIQKNKFLNTLKEELNTIFGTTSNENNKSKIKQLMRKIDKDINNEKYFKVFDSYFDDVHQDFLSRLKEKHPQLSPRELRMCAYIRMNISSKEIASLLNISIRGVEVSRYRLRKKLLIDHETNLMEYIMNL